MSQVPTVEKHVHCEELVFGSERIPLEITFDHRANLKIKVCPDLRVVVYAPSSKSLPQVLEKVKARAAWIVRQRTYFEQFVPRQPQKRYLSGESFQYLGRQYRLKVVESDLQTTKLIGRFFRVQTPNRADTKRIESLLDKWYRQHARQVFEQRMDECHASAKRYGIPRPTISIRLMKRRWGSCGGSQCILLNMVLVKAPLRCIDYVITHELCHLKYRSHSRSFYRLLSRLLPDWEARKERLEQVML